MVMLQLAVLDNHVGERPVPVDRQPHAPTIPAGVSKQPIESMLALSDLAKRLVAEGENVRLIAGFPAHAQDGSR